MTKEKKPECDCATEAFRECFEDFMHPERGNCVSWGDVLEARRLAYRLHCERICAEKRSEEEAKKAGK